MSIFFSRVSIIRAQTSCKNGLLLIINSYRNLYIYSKMYHLKLFEWVAKYFVMRKIREKFAMNLCSATVK